MIRHIIIIILIVVSVNAVVQNITISIIHMASTVVGFLIVFITHIIIPIKAVVVFIVTQEAVGFK